MKFAPAALEDESKLEWCLRQMLGTANFRAGPMLAFLSGNLCYQIEHHLFPDLPSNRYAQIAPQVRSICACFDLPYDDRSARTSIPRTVRTIFTLALPDRLPSSDCDAPKTQPWCLPGENGHGDVSTLVAGALKVERRPNCRFLH